MSQPQTPNHSAGTPSFSARIGLALRRYFVTGLATLLPVAVTIWLLVLIFNFADVRLRRAFGFEIPGLGIVVTLLVILAVGIFSVHFFGKVLFHTIEIWFSRFPFVRTIYPPIKQLAQFLFEKDRATAFRRVVLVEYPRAGSHTIAFVTNEAKTSVTGTQKTLLTLLIPQPPSPFTGPIILVPADDVIPLDISIEAAIKMIVSAGVVSTPLQRGRGKES